MARYIKCPCGQSDGNDDIIIDRKIQSPFWEREDMIITETRECDICHKPYKVKRFFKFKYETED